MIWFGCYEWFGCQEAWLAASAIVLCSLLRSVRFSLKHYESYCSLLLFVAVLSKYSGLADCSMYSWSILSAGLHEQMLKGVGGNSKIHFIPTMQEKGILRK